MRILFVEDDAHLGESIQGALSAEGHAVDLLTDGIGVSSAVKSGDYCLLLLDQRLPGKTGIEIIRELRSIDIQIPILMLTACDEVAQKVEGLDAGADDYLTKPFDMSELFARIRSTLRRIGDKNPILRCGGFELDTVSRDLIFRGDPVIGLTARELTLIELLLRNKGRFLTKERLLEGIYNMDQHVQSNTVEVYISRLRRRFGRNSIETLRGIGYRVREDASV